MFAQFMDGMPGIVQSAQYTLDTEYLGPFQVFNKEMNQYPFFFSIQNKFIPIFLDQVDIKMGIQHRLISCTMKMWNTISYIPLPPHEKTCFLVIEQQQHKTTRYGIDESSFTNNKSFISIQINQLFPECSVKPWFLNLGTADILDWMIVGYGSLSCALLDVQQHLWSVH